MKSNMLLVLTVAVFSAFSILSVVGCKSIPTNEQMYLASNAIGKASGIVANMTNIDDESRNAVIEILNDVVYCVPETNQTFELAWMPIAKSHVEKLVKDGKIDAGQGELIICVFNVVVNGLDYVFEVRYPKAKQYKELVSSAIDGFSDGFLDVFKPANERVVGCAEIDIEAFDWLKEHCKR